MTTGDKSFSFSLKTVLLVISICAVVSVSLMQQRRLVKLAEERTLAVRNLQKSLGIEGDAADCTAYTKILTQDLIVIDFELVSGRPHSILVDGEFSSIQSAIRYPLVGDEFYYKSHVTVVLSLAQSSLRGWVNANGQLSAFKQDVGETELESIFEAESWTATPSDEPIRFFLFNKGGKGQLAVSLIPAVDSLENSKE